jgi:PAS domain S-box-containing protein
MTIRIRPRGAEALAHRLETFSQAMRDLGQHEELLVAEDELRGQLEELARMGERLDAERERFVELFEHAPDAYVVTDRGTTMREINAAAVELFGVDQRYLRGKPLSAFVDEQQLATVARTLDGLEPFERRAVELTVLPRDRSAIRTIAHVSLTSRGQRLLWVLRRTDVEREPDAARDDVVRALRDKDDLLQRERHAREELELANRAKDRFIAVLSHDLRAPLNAILGWTQLLRREVLDIHARDRAFQTIERNARTQAKLIEELLDISRMAADRIQLSLTPIDFGLVVQRVIDSVMPTATDLGITITHEIEPKLVVIGDRERLVQVVTNLIANALKYTPPPGAAHVVVKREGGRVRLLVKDTGKGIDAALLPHVFEMYTQERTYASTRSGLGLGLYIVKQLVELHGGKVSAESAGPGAGATFIVSLPLHDEMVPLPAESCVDFPVALRGLRVMVVDDEEDSRELMAAILRRAGADVATASGIPTALDLFDRWQPDVVVSDLAMPGGDGCELMRMLRERGRAFTALAVSGFTSDADTDRALAAGFDVHVAKPVDAAELVEAVHEASRLRDG